MGAAIAALDGFDDPAVAAMVIGRWPSFGPAAREAALRILVDHRVRAGALLDGVESGRIERGALDLPRLVSGVDGAGANGQHAFMKKASTAELKDRLSRYIEEVKRGETVLVLERDRPVARLVPLPPPAEMSSPEDCLAGPYRSNRQTWAIG